MGTDDDLVIVEPLIAALADDAARTFSAEALGRLKDRRAVPALVSIAQVDSVMCTAAAALGDIGDRSAVERATLIRLTR